MKRKKMSMSKSRQLYKKTVHKTHRKNLQVQPMRGGTRL